MTGYERRHASRMPSSCPPLPGRRRRAPGAVGPDSTTALATTSSEPDGVEAASITITRRRAGVRSATSRSGSRLRTTRACTNGARRSAPAPDANLKASSRECPAPPPSPEHSSREHARPPTTPVHAFGDHPGRARCAALPSPPRSRVAAPSPSSLWPCLSSSSSSRACAHAKSPRTVALLHDGRRRRDVRKNGARDRSELEDPPLDDRASAVPKRWCREGGDPAGDRVTQWGAGPLSTSGTAVRCSTLAQPR